MLLVKKLWLNLFFLNSDSPIIKLVGCAGEGLQLLVSCPIGKKAENDVTKEA
jgi:hypothetical protein